MRKSKQLMMGCCIIALLFTGCRNGMHVNLESNVYTEEDMTRFYSDKIAIEELSELDIESSYADFEIIASDGYYVEYSYYYINNEPSLTIQNGKLSFSDRNMNTGNYSVNMKEDNFLKIYIPTTTDFDSIKITKSSGDCYIGCVLTEQATISNRYGDIMISNCQANHMNLKVSSGMIEVEKSNIANLDIANTYGQVAVKNLNMDSTPTTDLSVSMSSGKLDVENINCEKATLDNCYGEVILTDSTINELEGDFDSGNVAIDDSRIEEVNLDNSYGSIDMDLIGQEKDYEFKIDSSYGAINLGDETYQNHVAINHGGEKLINLKTSSGDIAITFTD